MKKLLIVIFALASFASIAGEQKKAPQSAVDEAISLCQNYAVEDGISGEELASYLLACVNDELAAQGYEPVDTIK
jgi:hypothetical protein